GIPDEVDQAHVEARNAAKDEGIGGVDGRIDDDPGARDARSGRVQPSEQFRVPIEPVAEVADRSLGEEQRNEAVAADGAVERPQLAPVVGFPPAKGLSSDLLPELAVAEARPTAAEAVLLEAVRRDVAELAGRDEA